MYYSRGHLARGQLCTSMHKSGEKCSIFFSFVLFCLGKRLLFLKEVVAVAAAAVGDIEGGGGRRGGGGRGGGGGGGGGGRRRRREEEEEGGMQIDETRILFLGRGRVCGYS